MSRMIIMGDSILYRNTTADLMTRRLSRPVTIFNTTRLSTLEIAINDVSTLDGSIILVSALANILSDNAVGIAEKDLEATVLRTVEEHVAMFSEIGKTRQRILFAPPLYREEPAWYPTLHSRVCAALTRACLSYPNFVALPSFRVCGADLQLDKVHLIPEVGKRFVEHVSCCLLDVCGGEASSSQEVERQDSSRPGTSSYLFLQTNPEPTISDLMRVLQKDVIPKLDELTEVKSRMSALEHKFFTSVSQSDVVHARFGEEIDFIKNKETRDRVVVVGYKADKYPSSRGDQKNFLATKFRALIESLVGEVVYDIYPKDNEGSQSGKVSPFDIRFPDVKICMAFKKEVYKKILEEPFADEFNGVYFNPKLTVGTRIRMEILRAISKKLVGDQEGGYCPLHNIRPILHIGPVVDGKVAKKQTLLFVDAVLRYKNLININDLSFANNRVGSGFPGTLRQNFLVLNDDDRSQPGATLSQPSQPSGSGRGRGTKRKFEGRGGRRSFSGARGTKKSK